MKTVQLIPSLPPAWPCRWKQLPMLDHLKRWQVRSHMTSSSQIQWACYKKWNGNPRLEWMVNIHLWDLLWVYCPGHAREKGNDWADRLAGKATITNGLHLGRSKCWGAWDITYWHKAKDIIPPTAWRRDMERGGTRLSPLKGWETAVVNQMNTETVSKQRWGNFWKTGWSAYGLFQAHWTELTLKRPWSPKLACLKFSSGSIHSNDNKRPPSRTVWENHTAICSRIAESPGNIAVRHKVLHFKTNFGPTFSSHLSLCHPSVPLESHLMYYLLHHTYYTSLSYQHSSKRSIQKQHSSTKNR